MVDSSGFLGILFLFLAEVVEFDLLSLGRVFSIYCNKSNVQERGIYHDLILYQSSQSFLYFINPIIQSHRLHDSCVKSIGEVFLTVIVFSFVFICVSFLYCFEEI
jgi:hypothetical protein